MKLAFNTWINSSFPAWVPAYPLQNVIKRLARIGYDGNEYGAAAPHAYPDYLTDKQRKEILRALDDNGIECSSMPPAPSGWPPVNLL